MDPGVSETAADSLQERLPESPLKTSSRFKVAEVLGQSSPQLLILAHTRNQFGTFEPRFWHLQVELNEEQLPSCRGRI